MTQPVPIYVVWPADTDPDDLDFRAQLQGSLEVLSRMTGRRVKVTIPGDLVWADLQSILAWDQ